MNTQSLVNTELDSFSIPAFQRSPIIMQAETFLRGGANPLTYYAAIALSLPTVVGSELNEAMNLLDAAELRIIQLVMNLNNVSAMARRKGNRKATKPADLYRKYSATLRNIVNRDGEYASDANDQLVSMYLEQTLPDGELESPSYRDSYTLDQLDPDDIEIKVTDASGLGLQIAQEANVTAADLGWDLKTMNNFIAANYGGFSELETDEVVNEDDRGFVPPTLLKDFTIDARLHVESWKHVAAFNTTRSEVFDELKDKGSKNWHCDFRRLFTATPAFNDMIECVARISEEDTVTGAAVFIKVEGDYGLTLEDIAHIRVYEDAYTLLVDFLDMNEDDIAELIHDTAFSPMSETDNVPFIEMLEVANTAELRRVMPRYDRNPIQTYSWNIGYVTAMNSGSTMDEAEGNAWASWRYDMSARGAKAYDETLTRTSNRKAAMSAFWSACGREVPRPQSKIAMIAGNNQGLILEGGRTISWTIAIMKLKGDELNLSGDIRSRLKNKLIEMGIGQAFVALL